MIFLARCETHAIPKIAPHQLAVPEHNVGDKALEPVDSYARK